MSRDQNQRTRQAKKNDEQVRHKNRRVQALHVSGCVGQANRRHNLSSISKSCVHSLTKDYTAAKRQLGIRFSRRFLMFHITLPAHITSRRH